ncbi:MAG TPA: alanine:cation symporter family protein, partial [Vicinamibacterales bacterium]
MKIRHLVLIAIALAAGSAAAPARAAATVPAAPTAPALAAAVPSAVAASVTSTAAIQEEAGPVGFMDLADRAMGRVNAVISAVLFFDMIFWDNTVAADGAVSRGREFPFVVLWLIVAAIFMTVRMGFINLRGFRHAIHVTAGKYTSPDAPGDMSHFAALSTALSATVGLGNIAGVAIAIMIGGPGATFWMIIAGLFGMTLKMTECTLAQMYRQTRPDGTVLGGPMQYLARGLAEKGSPRFGKALAVLFAIMCIGGSIAG